MDQQEFLKVRSKFAKKFQEEITEPLLSEEDSVFKPSFASLQDHIKNGNGSLDEGIRTTMKIGDLEVFGAPEDAPDESAVDAAYAYLYEGREMAPLTSLLPTLTVCGTEETKPGGWKVLYESERTRLWALLRMVNKMKKAGLVGCDNLSERCKKIVTDLLGNLPVVMLKMQGEDELWAEWNRSQKTGHEDLQHSTDRISVRFVFFSKLKQTLKNNLLLLVLRLFLVLLF